MSTKPSINDSHSELERTNVATNQNCFWFIGYITYISYSTKIRTKALYSIHVTVIIIYMCMCIIVIIYILYIICIVCGLYTCIIATCYIILYSGTSL